MHTMARGLVWRGMDVCVVTLRHGKNLPTHEKLDDIPVYRLSVGRFLMSQIDISIDKEGLRKLLGETDVAHVFSSIPSSILMSSLRMCRELSRVCVWQPIYVTNRFRYHKSLFVRFLGRLWDRFCLPRLARFPHAVVALTSAEAEFFRRLRNDLIVEVLGECVEEVQIDDGYVGEVLARYGLERDSYLLSVGRLVWYKGYDLLLEAWRYIEGRYRDLKLVIVGSDWGYKKVLLDIVERYGLRNVVFLEKLPFRELHALYEGSLAVVQLSRFETFHRVALEAWSHRKPIIALDLGPATEHIKCGGGILVRDSVEDVVKALKLVIEDRELRRRLGSEGYRIFRERYSVESYVDKLLNLYRRAMERR